MNHRFAAGILGWLFPGAGHAFNGDWNRALIIGGTIWLLFIIAVWGGGAYYPGLQWDDGPLLYVLNVFSRAGNVVGMVFSYVLGASPPKDVAELATFEYSGRLLEVTGMLNYLAAIESAWGPQEETE